MNDEKMKRAYVGVDHDDQPHVSTTLPVQMKRSPTDDDLAGKAQIPARTYGVGVQYCDFQYLLGAVLDIINMAVPNKQQHASAVRSVRRKFDDLYVAKIRQKDPNAEFALNPGGCVVEPLN